MEANTLLKLVNIKKDYDTGNLKVHALKGIDLEFRKSEFVSILGPSGCGKTTMLNIIGGLDQYTDGDLIIDGKSTKTFKASDWDTYRNHSIGFVFQSYNLIPHQTVLANVELALTLSGVSKQERRKRAAEALEKVGLGDQLNKRPAQLSGGQMQRVAIARALVNDPEILLADEPTGALDTGTSVQIMDILKEISREKLVIMVTHNPELAEEYSSRIIKVLDGLVTDDSNPYTSPAEAVKAEPTITKNKKDCTCKNKVNAGKKKTSMSFFTALSLSFNNLRTKKGRTIMTSFAGSIGIIGIALILALSNGITIFINQVQEDTLSTYPLSIQRETQDMSAMLTAMTATAEGENHDDKSKIYVDDSLGTMMAAMSSTVSNNLEAFKKYIDEHYDELDEHVSDIQYTYGLDLQVYSPDGKTKLGMEDLFKNMGDSFSGISELMSSAPGGAGMGMNVMSEMIDNQALLDQQYEVVEGHWPENENEIVLIIDKNNQISKMALYMLGILDQSELDEIMTALMTNGEYEVAPIEPFDMSYFLGMNFYLVNTSDFFEKTDITYLDKDGNELPVWNDIRDDVEYVSEDGKLAEFVKANGTKLTISGIIRPRVDATATSISGVIGYSKDLTQAILDMNAESEIINQQKANPDINVLTGLGFERTHYTPETIDQLISKIDDATMDQFYAYMTKMILTNEEFASRLDVKDAESFMQIFFLLPSDAQAILIESMLTASNTQDAAGTAMICNVITSMTGNVTVTADNLIKLLPIMSIEQKYVLLSGVPASEQMPFDIKGLVALTGEEIMSTIYAQMSENLKTMTVTEEIFLTLLSSMNAEDEDFITLEETLYKFAPQTDATYESTLKKLGDAEEADPASINFYAKDFESKDYIVEFIKNYNNSVAEKDKLQYSDLVGVMMSSVTTIINVISYVLIAFVAISLVVSSIMIGIITNISVLERTKEIGILRAVGASKKDISRVFNAETLIIGLAAGIIGIGMTLLLCLPTNAIIQGLTGFKNINAVLPVEGAIILVIISMLLTIIAGLIPARSAANKDPVIALRSE